MIKETAKNFSESVRLIIMLQQVVYILDQVRALEEELLIRIKNQGLNVKPQIVVVSTKLNKIIISNVNYKILKVKLIDAV